MMMIDIFQFQKWDKKLDC